MKLWRFGVYYVPRLRPRLAYHNFDDGMLCWRIAGFQFEFYYGKRKP